VNRTNRTQIGGWAALLAAVAIPLEIAALFVATGPIGDRLMSPLVIAAEVVRILGILVAAVGLHPWLHEIDRRFANAALVAGVGGAAAGLSLDTLLLAGMPPSAIDVVLGLAIQLAIGTWFVLAGTTVARGGAELGRIGWVGQMGGAGWLLAGASLYLPVELPSQQGGGPSLSGYAQVLAVFAVAFLVRLWRYVAFGKLPGRGLI
jgi:hypothetical protein